MSRLGQIRSHLNQEEANIAVFSDPATIDYLTGSYCDPHGRQMFLFVYNDREPVLFVSVPEAARASQIVAFPVFGYMDSEDPWQKIKSSLPSTDNARAFAELDNLNVTKFQGSRTVSDGRFEDLVSFIQKMHLIRSRDEVEKMLITDQPVGKAIQVGFDNISLDSTKTDVIAIIEFEVKK